MIEIEKSLERDIETIKQTTLNFLGSSNIISIYLYGGYGRGEGSWVLEEENGKKIAKPYNDYDIALVVKKKFSNDELRKLESEIKKKVDVKWIDLCQYTKLKLKLLKPTIKNYDFKYASKWIYGDRFVLNNIPVIDRTSITLKDVEILYITRLWTLVGSFPKYGLVAMPRAEEMFFRNQMAKCILSIVDNLLVVNKDYDASYKKRVDSLPNHTTDSALIDLSKWALEEKLFPKSEGMSSNEIEFLYRKVNKMFFKYFFSTLSSYYNESIERPENMDKHIIYNPVDMIKRLIKKVVFKDRRGEMNMYLAMVQGYLAYYYFDLTDSKVKDIKIIMEQKFGFYSSCIDEIRLKVAELRAQL